MDERFLHFAWQYLKFPTQGLQTTEGRAIQIITQGSYNTHAGPDFLHARIRIDEIEWAGHVEIHCKSHEWRHHKHESDPAYDNVVLHVVWEHNEPAKTSTGFEIPTLELNQLIDPQLIDRYQLLIGNIYDIPCANLWPRVDSITSWSQLEKAMVERLQRKSKLVLDICEKSQGDWEETAYKWLGRQFGFKTNQDAFGDLTDQLPWPIIQKNADNLPALEALLFGIAGFLEGDPVDEYHGFLQREYRFLNHKYQLEDKQMHRSQWKYLRLRPGNFPSMRLAQFATYIHHFPKLFSQFRSLNNEKELLKLWQVELPPYWQEHYDFGKKATKKQTGMGDASIQTLMINTAPVLLTAYAQSCDDYSYTEKALEILQHLKPEKNFITKKWESLNWLPQNALDSQGMIELHNEYCLRKRCLHCKIGAKIIQG